MKKRERILWWLFDGAIILWLHSGCGTTPTPTPTPVPDVTDYSMVCQHLAVWNLFDRHGDIGEVCRHQIDGAVPPFTLLLPRPVLTPDDPAQKIANPHMPGAFALGCEHRCNGVLDHVLPLVDVAIAVSQKGQGIFLERKMVGLRQQPDRLRGLGRSQCLGFLTA